ncbi:MAG: hypothetical protein S4CHLAM7_07570 [Chlamydiae bacterium]|nr:hypothetical protein [Chlamydiota bacterium]
MSFTSQVQPIGGERGITPTPQTDTDPIVISSAGDIPANSVGPEGSSDDPQELFPDTFVDMAKNTGKNRGAGVAKKRRKKRSSSKEETIFNSDGDVVEEVL